MKTYLVHLSGMVVIEAESEVAAMEGANYFLEGLEEGAYGPVKTWSVEAATAVPKRGGQA